MQTITVYGASDDLIEIEGDIREEFNHYFRDGEKEKVYLAFGDGSLIEVVYNGFWRLNRIVAGTAEYSKTEGTDESTDYSDKITLKGNIQFVALADQMERIKK